MSFIIAGCVLLLAMLVAICLDEFGIGTRRQLTRQDLSIDGR